MALYRAIVEQSRDPAFFTVFKAPDTVEGRFEVLTLHMYAVLRRLKGQGASSDDFAQTLFDVFFKNMDDSLRELGVGDMSIGRKIRTMAESFYGRVGAYEKSVDAEDWDSLRDALARNVYEDPEAAEAPALADYLRKTIDHIGGIPLDDLQKGVVHFPAIELEPAAEKATAP